jgi:hypothetical protein
MPQVTYLLVQEKTPTTYKILRQQISDDIPNTSKIQLLLDQAAVVVYNLVDPAPEPDQRVILDAWTACKLAV